MHVQEGKTWHFTFGNVLLNLLHTSSLTHVNDEQKSIQPWGNPYHGISQYCVLQMEAKQSICCRFERRILPEHPTQFSNIYSSNIVWSTLQYQKQHYTTRGQEVRDVSVLGSYQYIITFSFVNYNLKFCSGHFGPVYTFL